MTQQSDNIDIIRKAYDGWHSTKGDANVWLDILADEIELRSQGDGKKGMEFTCTRNCKKDVLEYFEGLANDWTFKDGKVIKFMEYFDTHLAIEASTA